MVCSLNNSVIPHHSVPRVDLADGNVETSSNIFYCFIALRDDADTLGNGFGCDRMVSSNHDNLKSKQTAMKALPVLQSNTIQKAGSLETEKATWLLFCQQALAQSKSEIQAAVMCYLYTMD